MAGDKASKGGGAAHAMPWTELGICLYCSGKPLNHLNWESDGISLAIHPKTCSAEPLCCLGCCCLYYGVLQNAERYFCFLPFLSKRKCSSDFFQVLM